MILNNDIFTIIFNFVYKEDILNIFLSNKLFYKLCFVHNKNLKDKNKLLLCCENNNVEFAKNIIKCNKIDINNYKNILFFECCRNNHKNLNFIKLLGDKCFEYYNKSLNLCCENNNLKIMKYMIEPNNINIIDLNLIFNLSFKNKNLEISKWLISIDKNKFIDIHEYDEELFRFSSSNNYLQGLKFLINLEKEYGKININVHKDCSFMNSVLNNNFDIVKYLLKLEKTHKKIKYDPNYLFSHSCYYNNLNMAKLLIKLEKTHYNIIIDELDFFEKDLYFLLK